MHKYYSLNFFIIFSIFPTIHSQYYPINANPICQCLPQQFPINQDFYGFERPLDPLPGILKFSGDQIILPSREEIPSQCSCLGCQLRRIRPNQLRIMFDLGYQQELAGNISKFIDGFLEFCAPPSATYSSDLDLFATLRDAQYKYFVDFYDLQWTGWKYLAIAFIIAFCISTMAAIALAFILCCKFRRN